MQVQLNTRVDVETMKALDEYCKRTGKSKASITDTALAEYLKKEEFEMLEIYNGEDRDITIVTDLGSVKIPAQSSAKVEIPTDAIFNQPEFYVQEEGAWYIKTSDCHTGCDAEIYDADTK